MKLSQLYEGMIDDLAKNVGGAHGMWKKGEDPGRVELAGDKHQGGYGTPDQPRRSGNQNTPMKPEHQKYFGGPKFGSSLEDGDEADREEDGILVPGQTIKTERPVPNRAGRPY